MKLSYADIEKCAVKALKGFMSMPIDAKDVRPVQIGVFACSHLRLQVNYTRLSDDGNVLGITTYSDTEVDLYRYCRKETIQVPGNTILIDESLRQPSIWGKGDKEINRRQFTIAHECAHHILFGMMSEDEQNEIINRRSARAYSLRELKRDDEWLEWQANALGAALIMPSKHIGLLMGERRLTIYGKRFNKSDNLFIRWNSNKLKVSPTALSLRLKQLGYIAEMPKDAFYEPSDIEFDDDFYSGEGGISCG
jgi:hypothetical protein